MLPAPPAQPTPRAPGPITETERRRAVLAFAALTLLICDLLLAGILNLTPWILSQFRGILRQLAETHTLRPTDLITGARAGIVALVGVDFLLLSLLMARALGKTGWLPGRTLWKCTLTRAGLGLLLGALGPLVLRTTGSAATLRSDEALYLFLCALILITATRALRAPTYPPDIATPPEP